MEINVWQYLIPALCGIITGAIVPIFLQWRGKRAEALKIDADRRALEEEITEKVLARAADAMSELSSENISLKEQIAKATADICCLTTENESLQRQVKTISRSRGELSKRVKELEQKCIIMQAEYDRMMCAFEMLCEQLRASGIEPILPEGIDEQIKK